MPRRIFPASTVTNTTGAPLRLTFHVTSTTGRRETDLYTVDGSNNLVERIPNGVILTDVAGAYSAFAGPDDIDTLYVGANGGSRSLLTATGTVAGGTVVDNGTYARVFGCSASTDAAIRDAVTRAQAAGGGVVQLPNASVALASPLPLVNGVVYIGTEPTLTEINTTNGTWLADGEWNYASGTVLTGDGTFAAFEANPTDQGGVPTGVGTTVVTNAGIVGVGLDNFTYGIHAGAANIMGLVYSRIDKVYIKNCSQWAVKLVNFAHCQIGAIYSCLSQNGHYYGAQMPGATFMPGNSVIGEVFNLLPRDGRDNRLCRGIVFEAAGTAAALNEIHADRVQANGFNRSLLSVSAGITSASTSVTVPDGTKFTVGMPVNFTTTANGYTLGQLYFVLSVSSNTLTLGSSRTGSAVSGTGTASMTLQTYGFPNVEIVGANTGAKVNNSAFQQIDSEGTTTCGIYAENSTSTTLRLADRPSTALVDIATRNLSYSRIESNQAVVTDFDASSVTSSFYGTRTSAYQRPLRGQWYDNTTQTYVTGVGAGLSNAGIGGDLQIRQGGFTYPTNAMGDRVFPRDTAITLSGANAGTVVFNGGTGITFTLPTIVTDTTPSTSHIGAVFDVVNVSANSLTVATDGTQLFNNVAAKTSLTVATQTGLRITASKTNGGTLFWTARPYALA